MYRTPSFTWKADINYTGKQKTHKLSYLTNVSFGSSLETHMQVDIASCIRDHHVKPRERKILFEDREKLYGWSMSQYLPSKDSHEMDFHSAIWSQKDYLRKTREILLLKVILGTPDDKGSGRFLECDLEYPFEKPKKNFYILSRWKKNQLNWIFCSFDGKLTRKR